jgi:hypothetical protein
MAILKDTAAQTTENSNACGDPEDVHNREKLVATERIEPASDDDCVEKLQTTELVSSQEIPARDIHPMKLIMLLRLRFGIGRYEISVRPLSRRLRRRHN